MKNRKKKKPNKKNLKGEIKMKIKTFEVNIKINTPETLDLIKDMFAYMYKAESILNPGKGEVEQYYKRLEKILKDIENERKLNNEL
jgi:hypothetical protein